MLKQIGLALLAVLTLGASVLWQRNKSLKRENRQLEAERDKARHEAKVAEVKAERADKRLKEQAQINDKFDDVDVGEDIKVGLDQ